MAELGVPLLQERDYINKDAEWEPDEKFQKCHDCGRKFTFLLRRHHCRCCGKVFCEACCGDFVHYDIKRVKILLPGEELPYRTCTDCITKLSESHLIVSSSESSGGEYETDANESVISVSYTHLDVYKRQVLYKWHVHPLEDNMKIPKFLLSWAILSHKQIHW